MFYCRPNKHEYERVLRNGKIYYACKNCRCCKLSKEATKRFTDDVKMLGLETAERVYGF